MQKSFTHFIWSYQSFFSKQSSELYHTEFCFDVDSWFENAIKKYEETLPEISDKLVARILERVS